jgi:hypothetical protein
VIFESGIFKIIGSKVMNISKFIKEKNERKEKKIKLRWEYERGVSIELIINT